MMEQTNQSKTNKGGRPPKSVKRNRVVALKCASYEQTMIRARAKKTGLTVSEYLRELGLNGQIVITERVLPKEVLSLAGTLNHIAANLNQIAKKRNSVVDVLNAADRASLEFLSRELKQLVLSIKMYLQ
ncbi:MAG: mobilization protein [Chitinophagaceae bacterium]